MMESIAMPAPISSPLLSENFNNFGPILLSNVKILRWKYPSRDGSVVINCDGSFRQHNGSGGYGIILRDHCGRFILAKATHFQKNDLLQDQLGAVKYGVIVLMIEMLAILDGLKLARNLGLKHVEVQSDSKIAISILGRNALCPKQCLGIFSDILGEMHMFTGLDFFFVYRESNRAADFLSKLLESDGEKYLTSSELPEQLQTIIIQDGIGVPSLRL